MQNDSKRESDPSRDSERFDTLEIRIDPDPNDRDWRNCGLDYKVIAFIAWSQLLLHALLILALVAWLTGD